MIFFTADLHLGHANIIRHCQRPFASADEMDKALIRNWNGCVSRRDEVYILGDFTMKQASAAREYIAMLNGRKYLIRGNHDRFSDEDEHGSLGLEWVKDYFALKHGGHKLVLFHYPVCEWDGFYHGAVHLYGHVHNHGVPGFPRGLAFNVGVDVNGFAPVRLDDILAMAEIMREKGHIPTVRHALLGDEAGTAGGENQTA